MDSIRRKAQWLHRYPTHTIADLSGDINTRLNKLYKKNWNGAIFADVGLQQLKLMPEDHIKLGWMVPAPAQGIIMITALKSDETTLALCKELNHEETEICAHVERDFLSTLEDGHSAPIGAVAYIKDEKIVFRGALFSLDGKQKILIANDYYVTDFKDIGKGCAKDILKRGGKKMMLEMIAEDKKKINILSTKELASTQTDLFNKDIGVEMSDFITVRYNRLKPNLLKNSIENVVITSQDGLDALLQNFSQSELLFKNIFCVGRRTKRKIERQISKVTHVENTAKELGQYLIKQKGIEEVTYFCGNNKNDDLTNVLTQNNITVNAIEVFRTLLNQRKFDKKFDGILFYSPSGIESYLVDNKNKDAVAFCIGASTDVAARKHFKKVEVAKLPTIESLIKMVNDYYK
jgi:uroporphyrinogen-III synthase